MTETAESDSIRLPGSLQDRLALGYLYLLLVGIASDSLYYGLVGVNIIQHSTALDVLLSPLVRLTDSLAFAAVIVLIPLAAYLIVRYAPNSFGKRSALTQRMTPGTLWLVFSGWIVLSAYLGMGFGAGMSLKESMADGSVRPDHAVVFQDGTQSTARLVGSNSNFAFLILDGETAVRVVPLHENVRSLARLASTD